MVSSRAGRMILIGLALVLAAAGLALILGRGCRAEPQPPATIAPPSATPAALEYASLEALRDAEE